MTSKETGWDATDSWLLEFQVWLPTGCRVKVNCSSGADTDDRPPDNFLYVDVNAGTRDLGPYWDDRTGTSGHPNLTTVSNVNSANRWHHVAMQKNTGIDDVRVYLDGLLSVTDSVAYPVTNFDSITIIILDPVASIIREFNVRTFAVYPITPYTPGPVTFAAAISDTQRRWNSYVLI